MCCLGLLLLGRGCQDLSPARSPTQPGCPHGTCASFLSSLSRFRVGHPCAPHLHPEVALFGGVLYRSSGPAVAPCHWPQKAMPREEGRHQTDQDPSIRKICSLSAGMKSQSLFGFYFILFFTIYLHFNPLPDSF